MTAASASGGRPDFGDLAGRVDLVVPSRGRRARHLLRTLRHLRDRGFPGRVLVRDHGDDDEAALVRRVAATVGGLDLAVDRDPDSVHFLERIRRAASASTAPYVMIHADDDFLLPAGAAAAVAALGADDGLALAQGRMARIALRPDGTPGAKPYPVRARTDADPRERLVDLMSGYTSLFYAVHRREALLDNLAHTLAWSTDTTFWQYLNAAVAVLQGRTAVVEDLFYLRLAHEGSWSYRSVADRDPEHPPWVFLSPDFSERLGRFRGGVTAFADRLGLDLSGDYTGRFDSACLALLRRAIGAGGGGGDPADAAVHARLADPASVERAELAECVRRVIASVEQSEEPT